ncbi:MAG TPA: hypothetical protein VF956_12385 [Candidatus Dormibacteraeota bacterium]
MSDEARIVVSGPSGSTQLNLPWSSSVGELFAHARSQLGLGDTGGYELWCADGVTMMNKLERSLQELRDRRICPKREFAIRASGDDRPQ